MTKSSESPTAGSLELFQDMVARLAEGLAARVQGDVEAAPAETIEVTRDALTADAPAGALLGRTVWSTDETAHSGCFLWLGNVGGLLGGGEKSAAGLADEELQTLDQSLRLNVEEGGTGDFPLEWSDLEIAAPDRLADMLRECGVPEAGAAVRIGLRIGETELSFLFFEEGGGAPAAEQSAADTATPAAAANAPQGAAGIAADSVPTDQAAEGPADAEHLEQLLDLRLSLTVRLGSTRMRLDDVLQLGPGSIVELDQREDEPLEVLANGRTVARGQVVVVDERFGLRVTEVGPTAERLAAPG